MKAWDSRLAGALARPLRHTHLRPNHVTTAGLLVGLGAAALYASGSARAASWGAAAYVLSALLDHVDGELARMTATSSARGEAYDRIADLTVRFALFAGMGVGIGDAALAGAGPVLGLAAGGAFVAIFLLRSAIARRDGRDSLTQPAAAGFELEDILYVIAPVTWGGWLVPFVAAAGVGAPLFAAWTLRTWLLGRSRGDVAAAAALGRRP